MKGPWALLNCSQAIDPGGNAGAPATRANALTKVVSVCTARIVRSAVEKVSDEDRG